MSSIRKREEGKGKIHIVGSVSSQKSSHEEPSQGLLLANKFITDIADSPKVKILMIRRQI